MSDLSHDLHFIVDFLVKDSILHKSSLFELLCSIRHPVIFGGQLVYDSERAFSNKAYLVVLRATFPFLDASSTQGKVGTFLCGLISRGLDWEQVLFSVSI